ncbi:MAG: hypothetical protein JWM98_933 [Thermoleophilia bacterium]|nr:hypothetical protein [Thermoleophilia bacterium]
MGTYMTWAMIGLLVLVGLALLIAVPGFAVLAAILIAVGLVWLVVAGIAAASGRGAVTSDTEDRAREARERGAR